MRSQTQHEKSWGKDVSKKQLVVCVGNKDYAVSLETRKIYVALRDAAAEKHGMLRIIAESGEDYLYPKALFRSIAPPQAVKISL